MLKVRLARVGKRGHAMFRIVATEHSRPAKSGSLEVIGNYDPHANALTVDTDRLKRHISHGAQLSPTVRNLLVEKKVLEGPKVVAWKPKKKAAAVGGRQETAGATGTTTAAPTTPPSEVGPPSPRLRRAGGGTSEVGAAPTGAPSPAGEKPAA